MVKSVEEWKEEMLPRRAMHLSKRARKRLRPVRTMALFDWRRWVLAQTHTLQHHNVWECHRCGVHTSKIKVRYIVQRRYSQLLNNAALLCPSCLFGFNPHKFTLICQYHRWIKQFKDRQKIAESIAQDRGEKLRLEALELLKKG